MGVRRFWLQNGDDQTIRYDFLSDSLLVDPQGLGFRKNISTISIGARDVITSEAYVLPTITGKIVFYKGGSADKYSDYQRFLDFVRRGNIRLYYNTPNKLEDDSFYCEGVVLELGKSEIGKNGVLECAFTFKATTQWQTSQLRSVKTVYSSDEEGKYYDLERDYAYGNSSFDDIELVNRGYDAVGFELTIIGNVTDPKLTLAQDGVTYGAVKINGTYDRIYINSKDGEEDIQLIKNGAVIANPISYQDMSIADGEIDVTFLKLRTGTTKASFNPSDFGGEVIIEWHDAYMSV